MVLGEPVKGIFTHGWRFVVDDALRISRRVREEAQKSGTDARLVAHVDTEALGIVEWFRREFMPEGDVDEMVKAPVSGQGGTWYLSLRIYDEKGEQYCGPPDARVIEQMQAADKNKKPNHKFNVARFISEVEETSERLREKWEEETAERLLEPAEMEQHWIMKSLGARAPKIYVPRSVG